MTRKRLSSQEAVQYILDLPSRFEMLCLGDEFSEDEIDLDLCNTNVINIEENDIDKEEDIDNTNNDENLEVQNTESSEGQEDDDWSKELNDNNECELGDKEDDEQR